ncbi:hypothetical protein [Haloterrigena gelatinilytica]
MSLIAGSVPAPLHNIGETHAWTAETMGLTAAWAALGAVVLFGLEYLVGGFDPE